MPSEKSSYVGMRQGAGFTPPLENLRRTGRDLRTRGILFQALPSGGPDPRLYRKSLDR